MTPSLQRQSHKLATASEQLRILNNRDSGLRPFSDALVESNLFPLKATGVKILQINVGKLCNQTCKHCHVDAGPDRTESMTRATADLCLMALETTNISTIDITGGAPELNPHFRRIVSKASQLGRHVVERCNLSVLLLPSQRGLAKFLADHHVEIIASLPYFLAEQTDSQRGEGVFDKSIEALRLLNSLGYGEKGSGLQLNLVYNPTGAFLPPSQIAIETDFRRELKRRYDVIFNSLYVITNMPISRFLEFLLKSGNYDFYMEKLVQAYNPRAAVSVMCRDMLSVGWDGILYDCDFNQMLELPLGFGAPSHIRDFVEGHLDHRRIVTGQHCFGCTAGAGSSCTGNTA